MQIIKKPAIETLADLPYACDFDENYKLDTPPCDMIFSDDDDEIVIKKNKIKKVKKRKPVIKIE